MGSFRIKALVNEGVGYKWSVGFGLSSVLKLRWCGQLAGWLESGGVCVSLVL